MRKRVDDALRKHELGEPLNRKELKIVQWAKHGGGCAACSGIEVAVKPPLRPNECQPVLSDKDLERLLTER